ncbi:MAG: alpha/beta hydrolase [Chloroflexota bacterium]
MPRERILFHSGTLRLVGELHLPVGSGPWPGLVLLHGLASRKERTEDFAVLAAQHGFAALAFDLRGHGESEGQLDGHVVDDVAAAVDTLKTRPEIDARRLAVRGYSLGGHYAVHAAAQLQALRACVAICPAPEWLMLVGLKQMHDEAAPLPADMRGDMLDYAAYLRSHDIREAVRRITPRSLLLIHATGDEVVPVKVSQTLYAAAAEPKELWLAPGGNHSTAQHDPSLHERSLRWLAWRLTP